MVDTVVARAGDASRAKEKVIHHIWIGSRVAEKELDYAAAWRETNAIGSSTEESAQRYKSTLWVDPNALLVNDVKKEVLLWAEWRALKEMGIHDVTTFDIKLADFATRQQFLTKKFTWASRKRYELARDLAYLPTSNLNDGERAVAIFSMRSERLAKPIGMRERQALLEKLAVDRAAVTRSINRGESKDINVVFNLPDYALMRQAYQQELNLRQNLAAAADIARMLVLKHEGGVYADLDLLPRFKNEAFIAIATQLEIAGYVMPRNAGKKWSALGLKNRIDDWRDIPEKLVAAITDAVVVRLGLIRGYVPTKAHQINPKRLPDNPVIREELQSRQAEILESVVNEVITARYPSGYDVFQPLGDIQSPMGFELGCYRGIKNGRVVMRVNNQFIISTEPKFINQLYDAMAKNYRFVLDPRVAHYLKVSSTGYGTEELWDELKLLWEKFKGRGRDGQFDAVIRYMADDILPGAISTVVISGPEVYREIAEKMLNEFPHDDFDLMDTTLYESQIFNAETSDSADSSWMARRQSIRDLRARQFPDAQPVATLADGGDATWNPPVLNDASAQGEAGSFNFHHQLIVQLDGDDVSRGAGQALFNKHPAQSMFAQLHSDELQFFFSTQSAQRAYERFGPGEFMQGEGPIRLTFVGHGRRTKGETKFGARTPRALFTDLALILQQGGYTATSKLVINLVGCYLEGEAAGSPASFAHQFVDALPHFLAEFGIDPQWVDVHARAGMLTIDDTGRKSSRHLAYAYREGSYVRESRLDDIPEEEEAGRTGHPAGRSHRIDFGRLRLLPPADREAGESLSNRHVVLTWGSSVRSLATAAAIFNDDPRNSIFMTLDGAVDAWDATPPSARTAYYDAAADALMVRQGLSILTDHTEHVELTVVGRGAGTFEAPTFNGATPEKLARILHGSLQHLVTGTHGADPAKRLTLTFEGVGSPDPLLVSSSTYMGRLSAEVLNELTGLGVAPEHVDIVAREGRVQPDAQGNRVYAASTGELLMGDLADVYGTLAESKFGYDPTFGRYERVAMTPDELGRLSGKLRALHGRQNLTAVQRDYLAHATVTYLKVLRHATGALPISPLHRNSRESVIAEIHDVLRLRQARLEALSHLQGHLGGDWKHVPEMVEPDTQAGGCRLGFVSPDQLGRYLPKDDHVKWVHAANDVFMQWSKKTKALGAIVAAGITRTGSSPYGSDYAFTDPSDVGAAHTISAAFLLQTLIGPEKGLLSANDAVAMAALSGKRVEALTADEKRLLAQQLPFVRAQIAVNYAQLTSGLVGDAAELSRAISVLKNTTPGLSADLAKVGLTVNTLGAAFDIANIVFASIELANAHSVKEKTEAGAKLGVSVVTGGMSIGSLSSAGLARWLGGAAEGGQWEGLAAGAGTVAETLGVLAVPVVGLGIGMLEVIKAFDHTAEGVDATLHALMRAAQAAQPEAIVQDGNVLRFSDSLVATSLDLSSGVLEYGNVRIRGLKPYNRLVAPNHSSEMLDLYRPFLDDGKRKTLPQKGALDSAVIILPSARSRDYDYTLVASSGWRYSHDFPLLETLEKAYPGKFYWWTYRQAAGMFGWDYSPSDLRTHYRATSFKLKLDDQDRTVVVPSIEAPEHRRQLRYSLEGGHGHYTVVLPAWPIDLDIDDTRSGHWQLDLTHAIYPTKMVDGNLVRGEMPAGQLGRIVVPRVGVSIFGRTVAYFNGDIPKDLTLFVSLDEVGGSKLVMRHLEGTRGLEEDPSHGRMETWIQSDTLGRLNPDEIARLTRLMVDGRIAQRHLRINTLDGGSGVLDLSTRHWVLASFDAAMRTSTLHIDDKPVMTIAASEAPKVGYEMHDEQGKLVIEWSTHEGLQVDMTYLDANLLDTHVDAHDTSLREYFNSTDGGAFSTLEPWLRQLPAGQVVSVENAAAEKLTLVTLGLHSVATEVVSYVSRSGPVTLDVDFLRQRAIVRVAAGHEFSSEALDDYADILSDVANVEIWVDDASSMARTSLDLTEAATMFRGKRISLITQGPIDLALKGSDVAWDTNDGDLVLQIDEHPPIRWIGVTPQTPSAHTLTFNAQTQRSLSDALAGQAFHDFKLHLPHGDSGDAQMMAWLDEQTHARLDQAHGAIDLTRKYYVGPRRPNGDQVVIDDEMDVLFYMKKSWDHSGFVEIFHRDMLVSRVRENFGPVFSLDANDGDPRVVLAMRLKNGATVNYQYREDELSDVAIFTPHRLLRDVSDTMIEAVSSISEVFSDRPIRLFDSLGNRGTASVKLGIPFMASYLGVEHDMNLAYDSGSHHLSIKSAGRTMIDLASLQVLNVPSMEISNIDMALQSGDGQRRKLRLDLADARLVGKRITVEADSPIDLEVLGGKATVRQKGDDLVFYQGDAAVLTWHDAVTSGAPAHTLKLGEEAAGPLANWLVRSGSVDVSGGVPSLPAGVAALSVSRSMVPDFNGRGDYVLPWESAARRMSDTLSAFTDASGVSSGVAADGAVASYSRPALSVFR